MPDRPWEELLMEVRIQLQDAEGEIRRQRRQIAQLKSELSKSRKDAPEYETAKRVYDYWKRTFSKNGTTKFGPAREKAVVARLKEGFEEEQLRQAIDGCKKKPFVGPHGRMCEGKKAQRHDDLALICRDETTVPRFMGYAEEWAPK